MTSWQQRSREEKILLNPGFCSNLLWHAARGYSAVRIGALSFEEAFLVLPIVLHRGTREMLPRDARTSLAAWLADHPLAQSRITMRAQFLVPFTREALLLGGTYGFIRFRDGRIYANDEWSRKVRSIRDKSEEVAECLKRAEFVGRWFCLAGNAQTVLALLGVKP